MAVLVICKYEEDPIKNEGARVLTRLYIDFFRRSRAGYSAVLGRIELKFKLILTFMTVLVTCKNDEAPIKNEGERVLTTFHYKYTYGNFLCSRAANSAVLG